MLLELVSNPLYFYLFSSALPRLSSSHRVSKLCRWPVFFLNIARKGLWDTNISFPFERLVRVTHAKGGLKDASRLLS